MRMERRSICMWLGCCAVALLVAACGSDDFGGVGGDLPLDVSQDSLRVELPPIYPTSYENFVPDLEEALEDREVLYLGNRSEGGWRATPMFRFDFSEELSEPVMLALDAQNVTSVYIDLEMLSADAELGLAHSLQIVELADTLRADVPQFTDPTPLFGDVLAELDEPSSTTFRLELDADLVIGWILAGGHEGIALYDLTDDAIAEGVEASSNFVGFAATGFTRFGSLLDKNDVRESAEPEIRMELDLGGGDTAFLSFPALLDLTVFERDGVSADGLEIGSHLVSRTWLGFDIDDDVIPGDATVNEARLEFVLDAAASLGDREKAVRAYEATRDDAQTLGKAGLLEVYGGTARFNVGVDSLLSLDVTDFVQRRVNLVASPETGLMVALDGELLQLDVARFFGIDALDPAARPRLKIFFTPPADTWN